MKGTSAFLKETCNSPPLSVEVVLFMVADFEAQVSQWSALLLSFGPPYAALFTSISGVDSGGG